MIQINEFRKVHRKWKHPYDWEFRAISLRIIDEGIPKLIVFGKSRSNGKVRTTVEIYRGERYIVDSDLRSYSRLYNLSDVPKKYAHCVHLMIKRFKRQVWSRESEVSIS